jgi:hypothetical protein
MTFTPGWYYQPGVKVSARPRAQLTLYSRLVLPTGSKSLPLLPVVNFYSRKRTPGWTTGSKGGCQPGVYVIPVLVIVIAYIKLNTQVSGPTVISDDADILYKNCAHF